MVCDALTKNSKTLRIALRDFLKHPLIKLVDDKKNASQTSSMKKT